MNVLAKVDFKHARVAFVKGKTHGPVPVKLVGYFEAQGWAEESDVAKPDVAIDPADLDPDAPRPKDAAKPGETATVSPDSVRVASTSRPRRK